MKKAIILALALCVCVGAQAQEKKKGGFMKALAKGVESATGVDVSKEALFVYPEMGKFRMSVVSCVGDPATGEVATTIAITKLFETPVLNAEWVIVREARVSGSGDKLQIERRASEPLNDLSSQRPVECVFNRVYGVPTDARTLNFKFTVGLDSPQNTFELRDCPITWQ